MRRSTPSKVGRVPTLSAVSGSVRRVYAAALFADRRERGAGQRYSSSEPQDEEPEPTEDEEDTERFEHSVEPEPGQDGALSAASAFADSGRRRSGAYCAPRDGEPNRHGIEGARRELLIANAYFVPTADVRAALRGLEGDGAVRLEPVALHDADPAQAYSALAADRTTMEATYAVLSAGRGLSLVKYL